MRLLVSLILLTGTSVPFMTDAGVPFNGLEGEELLNSVARTCRPKILVAPGALDGMIRDPFSGVTVKIQSGELSGGYEWGGMVASEWWRLSPDVYGDTVSHDLFNLIPLGEDVRQWRGSRPVSEVVRSRFDNGLWSSGLGLMGGEEFECYMPPEELRGRLARTFFYMATLYHVDIWAPEAYLIMSGKRWPGLSRYGAELLMDWHRTWAVDAYEQALNEFASRRQGNRNPFVDYPALAEHLWGIYEGEAFEVVGEPVALRGTYSLRDDRIDLWSPYVPDDALWTVDDMAVSEPWILTSTLGLGKHRFSYTSPSTGEKGCVMIKVVE